MFLLYTQKSDFSTFFYKDMRKYLKFFHTIFHLKEICIYGDQKKKDHSGGAF